MLLHVVTPFESGMPKRETFRFDWSGQSVRSLAAPWADGPESWSAILDGKVIEADEWDKPLNRGADVVVVPRLSGTDFKSVRGILATLSPEFGAFEIGRDIVKAFVAAAPPRIPDPGDDRRSPTFGFNLQTASLPGGSVPIVYGEHDAPGQRVHTDIGPFISSLAPGLGGNLNSGNEVLNTVIVLSSGPVESIGGQRFSGQSGALEGSIGSGVQLPSNVRVNSILLERDASVFGDDLNPRAIVELRLGEIDQAPLTIASDSKTTVDVGLPLDDENDEATGTVSSTLVSSIWVNVRFPVGLFFSSVSGEATALNMDSASSNGGFGFTISKRDVTVPEDNLPWTVDSTLRVRSDPNDPLVVDGTFIVDHDPNNLRGGFTVRAQVTPIPGAITTEIKLTRLTPRLGLGNQPTMVSNALFTNIVFTTAQGLIYPDVALLGLSIQAGEKLRSGLINIRARVKGKRIRVWDSVEGFSSTTWFIPASPFDWMTFDPGSNPAWVLLDFLTTDQGLGQFITDDDIDLQSFRDWSEHCDQDFYQGTDIFLSCDLVIDTPRASMDWIKTILNVGMASLVLVGSKFSVRYQYVHAHGAVPAKATLSGGTWTIQFVQIFSSANVADFSVSYDNPAFRPTVIDARILNKDLDYERDTVSIEDPNALGFNNPPGSVLNSLGVNKQQVDYIGITRVKQARYQALFSHNVNRLSRKTYTFRAGVDSIIAQPGDVIGIQSTAMRIGGNASFGANVSSGHTGNQTFIQITEAITIPPDEDWSLFVSDGDDGVSEGLIPQDASERTFAAGTNINIFTPGSPETPLSITYEELRPVAIGPLDSTVDAAQVISVTINEDLTATVRAMEWHPEFFDITLTDVVPPPLEAETGGPDWGGDLVDDATISTSSAPTTSPPPVPTITLSTTGSGGHRITWAFPAEAASQIARVYTRPAAGGQWQLLGEVNGTSIETSGLTAGTTIQISVSTQDAQGNFSGPGAGLSVTLTVDEFPSSFVIPQVQGFTATVTGEGILFTWKPFDADWVVHYEIRRGTIWNHSAKVGVTMGDKMFHVAGAGSYDYMIRARSKTGLYSATISTSGALAFDDVLGTTPLATYPLDDLISAAAGTLSAELQYDATNDWVEFQAGELRGTYTTTEIDGTTVADRWWSVNWDQHSERTTPIEDLTFTVDGGDAMWWTIEGREATAANPGVDFDLPDIDSSTVMVEDTGPIDRHAGSVGRYAEITVEARFHNGTSWGSYEPFSAGLRNAERAQYRFTLNRDRADEELRISKITLLGATVS